LNAQNGEQLEEKGRGGPFKLDAVKKGGGKRNCDVAW